MKISEVIKKLQEIQNKHGDIEVLAISDTYGTGTFVPLEEDGIVLDSYRNMDRKFLYIGW